MEAENLDTSYATETCKRHQIPAEAVAALRAKGVDLWVHDVAPVVFRKPTRVEFKRFMEKSQRDGQKANSIEELARTCIVYPESIAAVDTLFDRFPALMPALVAEINTVASGQPAEAAKKL
jgi:hypothetical protein